MEDVKIITVDKDNIDEHGCYCLKNRKQEGYKKRVQWLKDSFDLGLKLKMAYSESDGYLGMIEYIPGENSWRGFNNPSFMFIHCLYIAKKIHRNKGVAAMLLDECEKDTKEHQKSGIAVITSKKGMLADNNIFQKYGFITVDEQPPQYELFVKKFTDTPNPKLIPRAESNSTEKGLHIIYTDQCPFNQKSLEGIKNVSKEHNIKLTITELKTPQEAQHSPSIYGVFNILYNGELVADYYVSETRLKNILKKKGSI